MLRCHRLAGPALAHRSLKVFDLDLCGSVNQVALYLDCAVAEVSQVAERPGLAAVRSASTVAAVVDIDQAEGPEEVRWHMLVAYVAAIAAADSHTALARPAVTAPAPVVSHTVDDKLLQNAFLSLVQQRNLAVVGMPTFESAKNLWTRFGQAHIARLRTGRHVHLVHLTLQPRIRRLSRLKLARRP